MIDGAIHEAARPGLLDECQKLNGCETGECKVTLAYKLTAKHVFHTVIPRDNFSFINLYNPNTEKEQVFTWEKLNLMLQTFDDFEKIIIILGGNFNLFLDSVLEAEGGCPVLKKSTVSKLIEIKEKYNLSYIWRIRNTKEKRFTFRQKHRSGFLQRRLFQIPCRNQLRILKFYLHYLLIILQFSFL